MNQEHEQLPHVVEDSPSHSPSSEGSFKESIGRYIEKYGPYLTDLWVRLYVTTMLFCVVFAAGFLLAQPILAFFLHIFTVPGVTIVATTPFQFVDLSVDVGFFFAFLITIPYFTWQVCAFIRPAVSKREFYSVVMMLPFSIILFATGFAYAFAALYVGLKAMAALNISIGLQNYWDISAYISTVIMTSTLLGILFEFPVVITALIRIGIMDRRFLIKHRRGAYAAIVVFVALLPPTDGLSLVLMAIPLVLLYEITVLINRPKVLISRARL